MAYRDFSRASYFLERGAQKPIVTRNEVKLSARNAQKVPESPIKGTSVDAPCTWSHPRGSRLVYRVFQRLPARETAGTLAAAMVILPVCGL